MKNSLFEFENQFESKETKELIDKVNAYLERGTTYSNDKASLILYELGFSKEERDIYINNYKLKDYD